MKSKILSFFAAFFIFISGVLFAGDLFADSANSQSLEKMKADIVQLDNEIQQIGNVEKESVKGVGWWTGDMVLSLSLIILGFGVIVLGFITYVVITKIDSITSDLLLKVYLTPLIIVCAVFLIITGYSEQQVSPIIGLLGTIAGYLLAKGKE